MGKSKGRKPGQQGDRSEQNVPLIKEPDIVVASTASLSPGDKKLRKALENRRKEEELMNAVREVEKKKEAESKRKPKTNIGSTPKKRIELPDMAKEGEREQTVKHQAMPVYPHTDFTKSVDVPEEGATEQGEKFKYQATPFARSNPGYREHNPRVEASDYGCQNVPYSYKMEKNDLLFKTFMYKKNINCDRIIEKKGDLFSAPEDYSLAHCVAEDFNMGAGIALTFRSKYKQVAYLLDQNQRTGGLAVLNDNQRFIYYLVTKKISRGKPTLYTLWLSLQKLKKHCEDNNVTKLAIPQIGCGLDRLDWETVKRMLAHVFEETPVEIVVYIWEQPSTEDPPMQKTPKKCTVVHQVLPLLNVGKFTGLIYFASVDGVETQQMLNIAVRCPALPSIYKGRTKCLGEVVRTEQGEEFIYGLVVKPKLDSKYDFSVLEKALMNLRNVATKDQYQYVAFEGFVEEDDDIIVDKILSLMQFIFRYVEIWVCWPEHLQDLCPIQYPFV